MSELIAKQRGRLRSMVLWLLYQSPKRGIDIIDDIYKMTWGFWKPSPGSVYPLLAKMEEEGVIKRVGDRYTITEKGVKEIEEILPLKHRDSVADAVDELEGLSSFFREVDKSQLSPYKERITEALKKIEEVVRGG
ncbi:PadR family transcriptional regulator [Stygiolobus caldivivus]|uniref:PadR family transcriptional regulator n=1 Tax=Stygiolobus caldivivus TaxID=2824673 RepID=A0A8D5U931_9CREN|nr:PadR family transcriptional regulator [Stygiolobus caldivivus]BCU71674.1 PadR family transcriptional regulator [Stygiolobus caldivivus]